MLFWADTDGSGSKTDDRSDDRPPTATSGTGCRDTPASRRHWRSSMTTPDIRGLSRVVWEGFQGVLGSKQGQDRCKIAVQMCVEVP